MNTSTNLDALAALDFEPELPCDFCVASPAPATHVLTLECGGRFLICDRHAGRARGIIDDGNFAYCSMHCGATVPARSLRAL